MPKYPLLAALGSLWFAGSLLAQDTNALPRTRLEAFETNTGTILIKGFGSIGSLAAGGKTITVSCREDIDASSGSREYGVAVGIRGQVGLEERVILDYEELDPILNAIDYLNRVDWTITSLTSFDAAFTTRSGFRISAFGWNRTGLIEFGIRGLRADEPPILFTRDDLAKFRGLIDEAKRKLDSVRK